MLASSTTRRYLILFWILDVLCAGVASARKPLRKLRIWPLIPAPTRGRSRFGAWCATGASLRALPWPRICARTVASGRTGVGSARRPSATVPHWRNTSASTPGTSPISVSCACSNSPNPATLIVTWRCIWPNGVAKNPSIKEILSRHDRTPFFFCTLKYFLDSISIIY